MPGISSIKQFIVRLREIETGLSNGSYIREELEPKRELINAEQREQLMEGKASDGNDIRPYYTEDPFFKTKEDALRYAAYKQKITPNSKRKRDAPNLYINGKFHSELEVQFRKEDMVIDGITPYAKGIVREYGLSTFGLTEGRRKVLFASLGSSVLKRIKKKLYAK